MSARGARPREVFLGIVRSERLGGDAAGTPGPSLLAADERRRWARLRPEAARRDYLAAHLLSRMLAAHVLGVDPSAIRMRAAENRPPELVAPPGALRLGLSLSHADGIAICAVVSGCAVGVDVESLRNVGPDPIAMAETLCSEGEKAALLAVPASERLERFLSIWTAKEAVAKATGLGFRLPFAQLTVAAGSEGERGAQEVDREIGFGASRWSLRALRLTSTHVAAVAVPAASGGVVVRLLELAEHGGSLSRPRGHHRPHPPVPQRPS